MKLRALLIAVAVAALLLFVPRARADIDLKDEGVSKGRVTALNCVGPHITCTRLLSTGQLYIPDAGAP